MCEELDTSWFDLKKYDKLNELDLDGWGLNLNIRSFMLYALNFEGRSHFEDLLSVIHQRIDKIKENPIINNSKLLGKESHKYLFNTYSVESIKAYDFWTHANEDFFSDVWECCELNDSSYLIPEQQELIDKPLNVLFHERNITNKEAYIQIDLSATDEQIKSDFNHWLKEYRKFIDFKSNKRNFTDTDLLQWIEYRILPYIDLTLIAKIEKKTITQAKIARLIYPNNYDTDIDITERLRRIIKPKADWLLKEETIKAINIQVQSLSRNNK